MFNFSKAFLPSYESLCLFVLVGCESAAAATTAPAAAEGKISMLYLYIFSFTSFL